MWSAMTSCGLAMLEAAMRHDPASGAIVIMLRSLKMHGPSLRRSSNPTEDIDEGTHA